MEITWEEYFLVRQHLQRLATPRFLSEPVTCVDEALKILVGVELRALRNKAEASPPVLPAVAAPPSSSALPSASSNAGNVNYVR